MMFEREDGPGEKVFTVKPPRVCGFIYGDAGDAGMRVWAQRWVFAYLVPVEFLPYRDGWAQAGVSEKKESGGFLWLGTATSLFGKDLQNQTLFVGLFLKSFGGTQLTWLPPFPWIPNLKDLVCVPNCPESAGSIFKIHGFCTQPEFFTVFFTAPWSYLHDLPQTYPLKWPCYTEQYLITGRISE